MNVHGYILIPYKNILQINFNILILSDSERNNQYSTIPMVHD